MPGCQDYIVELKCRYTFPPLLMTIVNEGPSSHLAFFRGISSLHWDQQSVQFNKHLLDTERVICSVRVY